MNRSGFTLEGYKNSVEFYCKTKEEREIWITHLKGICILPNMRRNYKLVEKLDKGNFGTIYLGIRDSDNKQFAIKTISKKLLLKRQMNIDKLVSEIKILRLMNHPRIMKLYEVYESDAHVHLVMEYIRNGNLLSHLKTKGTYNEKEASYLIMQALEILAYCHSLNIVHRDLKPENLMIEYYLQINPIAE